MSAIDTSTLAFHKKRPVLVARDFTDSWFPDIATLAIQSIKSNPTISPDEQAATFYYLNHALSLVASKVDSFSPLGKYSFVTDVYFEHVPEAAKRMLQYLILICSREARHVKATATFWKKLEDQFGPVVRLFFENINGSGYHGVIDRLKNDPPQVKFGLYTSALEFVFFKGKFHGGYGGPKWGEVAKCLRRCVHGETSPEIMLDTGFTLAHNNGPIFNKSMLYTGYTEELRTLLDVQRAGMLPQLINDSIQGMDYLTQIDMHIPILQHEKLLSLFGSPFDQHLDWAEVKTLGALTNMQSYIYKQQSAPWFKGSKATTPMVYIMPSVAVKKIVRKKEKEPAWSKA